MLVRLAISVALIATGFDTLCPLSFSEAAATPGTIKWYVNLDTTGSSPAVASDGTIYMADNNQLYAINVAGKIKWSFLPRSGSSGMPVPIGSASPSVKGDSVYIMTTDGFLHAVQLDGTEKWKVSTRYFAWSSGFPIIAPAKFWPPSGAIFVAVNAQAGYGYLEAYTPDGQWQWERGPVGAFSDPIIDDSTGTTYIMEIYNAQVYVNALSPSLRSVVWRTQISGSSFSGFPAAMDKKNIYVATDAGVTAIDRNGVIQYVIGPNANNGVMGAVVVGNGIFYGGTSGNYSNIGQLSAFYASTGNKKWTYRASGNMWGSPCIGSDGVIYAVFSTVNSTGMLHAINPDGTKKWVCNLGIISGTPSSPIINNKVLYVGLGQRLLAVNVSSASLAKIDWPCVNHDLSHTGDYVPVQPQSSATIYVGPYEKIKTIQAGIDTAKSGDTIIVKDGTYTGAGNLNLDLKGKILTLSCGNNGTGACTIDAQQQGRGFYFHSGESNDTVVSGFTIKNGKDVIQLEKPGGGGILIYGACPTIRGCTITGCEALGGGGIAIYANSAPSIENSVIAANTSYSSGGGILSQGSSPTIKNSTISSNIVGGNADGARGGGIFILGPPPLRPPVVIDYCTISGNHPGPLNKQKQNLEGGGAAISGNVILSRSSIVNNRGWTGGGIAPRGGSSIVSSTISGNSAGFGGAIYSRQSYTVSNSIFTDNRANFGGTVNTRGGQISNCTFTNTTGTWITGTVEAINCIFWGNSKGFSGSPNISFSDVMGGWPGDGNIDADPLFIDALNGDYRLSVGSPCIDAGFTDETILQKYDKHGVLRISGGVVDMGAYEYQGE